MCPSAKDLVPADPTKPQGEPLPAGLSPGGSKRRILVVDDEFQIRESLQKVLGAEGYEVSLAANSQEALKTFNNERIDLVLLDLNLPVNSGWDIFGTLTSQEPGLPIIIITGRENQSELASAAGISALMEKPLNVKLLLQTIADLLAEDPMARLKRLVGLQSDLRYIRPFSPSSTQSSAFPRLSRPPNRGRRSGRRTSGESI